VLFFFCELNLPGQFALCQTPAISAQVAKNILFFIGLKLVGPTVLALSSEPLGLPDCA